MANLQGTFVTAYTGVNATNPPQFVLYKRAPTIHDFFNFNLGTIWVHQIQVPGTPPTYTTSTMYILVALAQNIATWVKIGSSAVSDIITTSYNTPGQTGTHVLNSATTVVEIFMWGAGNSGGGGGGGTTGNAGYGGGGGGFTHLMNPVSFFGGAGSSVTFSTAAQTVGATGVSSANPSSGNVGATSTFGNIETMTTSLNITPSGVTPTYMPWGGISPGVSPTNIITLAQIGGGLVDNGSEIDFGVEYCLFNLKVSEAPYTCITNGVWNFIGHMGNLGSFGTGWDNLTMSLTGTSLPTGGGGGGNYSSVTSYAPNNGSQLISYGPSANIILAGGLAGTSGNHTGSNGLDGSTATVFMAGGTGGGGGYYGGATGGNGGNGGYPGGGGGGGGGGSVTGGNGGNGAGGMLIVVEYI